MSNIEKNQDNMNNVSTNNNQENIQNGVPT
uniref:Uncharacterized protein n=1 Tax=Borrelia garinii subsp. bavariensis (strain ATCC BAA-2496 / DSM 23469 / PBi) TaxID=290434 RepID=A0A7I6GXR4_BORGP|nr:hypothetical protein BGP233 [Borreliella bavariensis PBi]